MPEFDFDGLRELLADSSTKVELVMIPAAALEGQVTEDGRGAYMLDLAPALQADLRTRMSRVVADAANGNPDDYDAMSVPEEGTWTVASVESVSESPLIAVINAGRNPGAASLPRLDHDPGDAGFPAARGYAVIVRQTEPGGKRAVFVRRRDPAERLERGRFASIWSDTRLERATGVVTFDSLFDAAVWADNILIRSFAAFEAMFFPRPVRAQIAERVAGQIQSKVKIKNFDAFVQAARDDTVFAARLRRLGAADVAQIDISQLERSLKKFGLHARFIDDSELVFPTRRQGRWPFIQALEDGLVESPGSQSLYRAESKRRWPRRLVAGAIRREDGQLVGLCGPGWGPIDVGLIKDEIDGFRGTYYVPAGEEIAEVVTTAGGVAATVASGDDALSGLPDCPTS